MSATPLSHEEPLQLGRWNTPTIHRFGRSGEFGRAAEGD